MAVAGQEAEGREDLEFEIAFLRHVKRAELYEETWWAHPVGPHTEVFDVDPGLKRGLVEALRFDAQPVSTRDVFRAHRGWTPGRTRWQVETLASLQRSEDTPVTGGLDSLSFVTLGLPGSGKSSVLRRIAAAFAAEHGWIGSQVVADADDLRERFPEYAKGLGSRIVQDELVRLAYGALDDPLPDSCSCMLQMVAATERGTAVLVIDTVGDPRHTPGLLRRLTAAGWKTYVLLAECSVEKAVERAKRRALEIGRIVDPDYIRSVGSRPAEAFSASTHEPVAGFAAVEALGRHGTPPILRTSDPAHTFGAPGEFVAYW